MLIDKLFFFDQVARCLIQLTLSRCCVDCANADALPFSGIARFWVACLEQTWTHVNKKMTAAL